MLAAWEKKSQSSNVYSRRRNYRKNETGKSLVYGIVPKMVIYRFGIIEKNKKIPKKVN